MLKPIRSDEEYKTALQKISMMMERENDLHKDEIDQFEGLVLLIEAYQNNNYPISYPRKLHLKSLALAVGVEEKNSPEKITAPALAEEPAIKFGALQCSALQSGVKPLGRRQRIPEVVYQPGLLEHPAIPGLNLSLEQRLYGAALEYINLETGETCFENMLEKRMRVFWQRPVPMTKSRTGDSFVKMDLSLFPKK